ncbi:MAG TPA: thioredoxin domain-containing protein, partial [Bacteroidales bacterium]|nr:thioredoxin domain-containing protein [Bacteroidales bacterium]
MNKYTNNLIHESSPYLLQHAHNPVEWYPWGDEALKRAKDENKILFISIGYAACHWCHVMERESFEKEELAQKLNDHFICIKVDRQERPDVDQVYMSAVQLMTGNGGWPLTCFATPDARPFYGGTYFPPAHLMDIIEQVTQIWTNEPQKIVNSASSIHEGVVSSELIKEKVENPDNPVPEDIYRVISDEFDHEEGGLKRVPKFPMPGIYRFLLHYHHFSGNHSALDHVKLTVEKILRGGIYDQLGGGIARYSTDGKWKVPHFEKMLYDNAQFISLLADLYTITKDGYYKQKLYECTGFLERELQGPDGGFCASMDADSADEEGKYYAWDSVEIDAIAGDDSELVKLFWGITTHGNWEAGKNVLVESKTPADLAEMFDLPEKTVRQIISETRQKLRTFRELREKPPLDTKILTSWNALMLEAYTDAWQATGDAVFYDSALKLGTFIRDNLVRDNYMVVRSMGHNSGGFLDDYAFSANAFFSLYQISFDEQWLNLAAKITEFVVKNFFNLETGMFYYTPASQTDLVLRQTEVT